MSRSYKKIPKQGISTSTTEKEDKREANRTLRRVTKDQVQKGAEVFATLREVSNVWSFGKDGKVFLKQPTEKDMRK
ncbi:hypothetical protein [Parachryseolinea silvisoli]|uniref:hypothetical protein n=1 Tax=Parachryseolinea silvisoli TaxID=2873601 RepID=UPI0022659864|nr:hypothetical protein [Parachryseolinea silvisoli]MCD9016033.1 hypothetical protein [Parachryseolinea silvisoli]